MKVKVPWGFKESDNFLFPDDFKMKEVSNQSLREEGESSDSPIDDKDYTIMTVDHFEDHIF